MKTKFFSAAVIAMAMFATSNVFTSCSKDSDDTVKPQKTVVTQATSTQSTETTSKGKTDSTATKQVSEAGIALMRIAYSFGEDFFKVYDAKITYTSNDGQQMTENITEANTTVKDSEYGKLHDFSKTLKFETFPIEPNFKIEVTPKADSPVVKGDVGVGLYYILAVSSGKKFSIGNTLGQRKMEFTYFSKKGLEVGQNVQFLNELKTKSQMLDEFKLTVAKDGTMTSNHNDKFISLFK